MAKKRRFRVKREHTEASKRVLKLVLSLVAIAQAITIIVIGTVDQIRKRRQPGGFRGFPVTPPTTVTVANNTLTTYTDGYALYDDMITAIDQADEYVYFETYLWKNDKIGQAFKNALIAAAARGVEVYIVYDSFGNTVVNPLFYLFPRMPSLHVLRFPVFRPELFAFGIRGLGVDHRKLLVVDGVTGFVGGYNIGKLYAQTWRDTHLRIVGPSVWELDSSFASFWNTFKKSRHPGLPDQGARQWEARIRSVANTPHRLLFPIRGLYLDVLDRATKRIWITQAYFIPDKEIMQGLIRAARRGVDVKILIPERSNHVIADWVSRVYYSKLLDAGVELWLYQHAMIHAKTATIDGRWTTIGTANIDRLSMTGNFEINLEVYSNEQAQCMENIFRKDLTTSRRLTKEEWHRRNIFARIAEQLLAPFYLIT